MFAQLTNGYLGRQDDASNTVNQRLFSYDFIPCNQVLFV